MSGSISDLVITSAAFDKDRRRSTTSRVRINPSFQVKCVQLVHGNQIGWKRVYPFN